MSIESSTPATLADNKLTGFSLLPKFRSAIVAALLTSGGGLASGDVPINNNGDNTGNVIYSGDKSGHAEIIDIPHLSNTSSTIHLSHGSGTVHVQNNNGSTQIRVETTYSSNTSESGFTQWVESLEIEDILIIGFLIFIISSGTGVTYTFVKRK